MSAFDRSHYACAGAGAGAGGRGGGGWCLGYREGRAGSLRGGGVAATPPDIPPTTKN